MPVNANRPGPNRAGPAKPGFVSVWDPFVRIAHWALAIGFLIAYVSPAEEGAGPGSLHVWSGYALGAIVLLRLIWGFVGPRYARFSDFIFRPATVFNYFKDIFLGSPRRYLGHSPAGGAMILALLAALASSVVTGIAAYGQFGSGVLAHALGALHDAMTVITLILAILHVIGIAIASVTHRENLVAAMFSGKKRPED